MKLKAPFAFLAAATCLFAACSNSSDSGDVSDATSNSRVKNEALTVVAPVIDKIEPGDSSLTVYVSLPDGSRGNTWFYQVSAPAGAENPLGDGTETVDNAPASFTINGLTNGATYTVRVAHWDNGESSYVSATAVPVGAPTTTVVLASCSTGGDCKIGDTGPGGGIVFFDAGTPQPWGRYLEVAPKDLGPTAFGCVDAEPAGVAAVGAGFENSSEIALSSCGADSAAKAAFAHTVSGSTGWYLPSRDELNELCKYANNQATGDPTKMCSRGTSLREGFSPTYYWSSTQNGRNRAWYQSFVSGQQLAYGKPAPAALRPIRAFTNKDGVTVPTTIAAPRCDRGGECKVGDTGPGGGVVFYVAPSPQPWGQYMEITTDDIHTGSWSCDSSSLQPASNVGSGKSNTSRLRTLGCAGPTAADNYVSSTGIDDWFLPSLGELELAAQAKLLRHPPGTSGVWTSTTNGGCFGNYGCFMKTVSSDGATGSTANGFYSTSVVQAVRMFGKVG